MALNQLTSGDKELQVGRTLKEPQDYRFSEIQNPSLLLSIPYLH